MHTTGLTRRAKFKKFNTESDARSFVGSTVTVTSAGGKPYQRPLQRQPSKSKGKGVELPPAAESSSRGGRADSPVAYAQKDDLPRELQKLASMGFNFSKGDRPRLVVYTDGSGLSNGKVGATAGAGVYWGEGEASKYNLAERVPGEPQTNNRGELLVSRELKPTSTQY